MADSSPNAKADPTVPITASLAPDILADERRYTLRFDDTEALRILCGERDL